MKKIHIIILALCICFSNNIKANASNAYEIMKKARNRYNGNDSTSFVKMSLVNSMGKVRIKAYKYYRIDYNRYGTGSKTIFVIKRPNHAKGVIFLQWSYGSKTKSDDRWLYLPALRSVRRISGSTTRNSFLGSDLSYEDLAMGTRSVDLDNFRIIKEEIIGGRKCWAIEAAPKDKTYVYSKYVTWISQDDYIGMKTVLYDRNGNKWKEMLSHDIKKVQNVWTVMKMEVKNFQDNHRTIIEIPDGKIKYNVRLGKYLFRASSIEKGWVK